MTVQAIDLDGDTLHYSWTDDSGRSLGLPDSPSVDWPLPNLNLLNTIHVQVSDGRGGIVTQSRTLQSGPDAIFFAGRVFNRATNAGISGASVSLNNTVVQTDSAGNFRLSVPDAAQFVLNVSKPGFALASIIYHTRATGIAIPLDAVQTANIDGGTGGTIDFPPPECRCPCPPRRHGKHDYDKEGYDKEGYDKEGYDKEGYKRGDYDEDEHERDGGHPRHCIPLGGTTGSLSVGFPPGALLTSTGLPYTGTASVEGHQYDLTQPNPIPGDLGAVYRGFSVRMGTFGAFHLLARDAQGHPLALAPGQTVSASMPIQSSQLATAPPTIPFFHYDETTRLWAEDGTLTRTGNRYVGQVTHFSVFNADTVFPGGACVKVVLDNSFKVPVTLDASYFDPNAGQFYHNNFQTSDERMQPNQNFTLTITDSNGAVVSVPLFSGTGLDPNQFPGGLDTDTVNFSHCHGPVQISNNTIPSEGSIYFLGPPFGGSITDHSADYQKATDAQAGGSRDTLNHWKTVNGFPVDGSPAANEAKAIYWNNGDLKFGRDMHCRVTNTANNATACYVSNFGNVGTNDAVNGLSDAEDYEKNHQGPPAKAPKATVAMEYDPTKGAGSVQFWAYKGDGSYFPQPALDFQGAKPMPDMCMSCHHGTYSGNAGDTAQGATFLAFDLSSFKDDTDTPFPASNQVAGLQEQFRQLNNMVVNTSPPPGTTQLVNLWYHNAINTPNQPFDFAQHAAQLTPPFSDTGVNHDPLYDTVVSVVCRTCHAPIQGLEWNSFSKMPASFIQSLACRGSGTNNQMPHAEVPWIRFWQNSLSSTLDSELNFGGAGCPNQ